MDFKRFAIILILFACMDFACAQSFVVDGRVCDKTDNEDLIGSTIKLLSFPDSTYLSATSAHSRKVRNGEEELTSQFSIILPSRKSKYILEISATGYETAYVNVVPSEYGTKSRRAELPLIFLSPKTREIGEVTVSASRIKFFNRGDTVVFNADAFRIADGSMLDALVAQLPGVELKSNGQIYYNGKYIESLMLDGKHFFNGNNQLMLENIGAYTVKDIKIYDKAGDASDFAGRNLGADKELVMDVRLKKEYSTGLIANIEGGFGTDSRYLGRLFGMWFTADTRLTLYANSNNLNDDRKPGRADSWTPADLRTGESRITTGGFDYSIDKKKSGWRANGDVIVKHTDLKDRTGIYRTNFLTGGDTYERTFRNTRNRDLSVTTRHSFYLKRNVFDLSVNPRLEYGHRNNRSTTAAITLPQDVQGITFSDLINFGQTPGFLTDYINRHTRDNLVTGNTLTGALTADSRIKVKNSSNIIRVGVNGLYSATKDDRFERYELLYSAGADAAKSYDRYFKNHPDHKSRIGANVGYNIGVAEGITLEITYRYAHSDGKTTSSLFNLHQLGGNSDRPLGMLPSASEYAATLDSGNSYISRTNTNNHVISPLLLFEKGNISGQFNIPVTFSNQRLAYQRGSIDTTIVRNTALLNIDDTFIEWKPDKTKKFTLMYNLQSESPDLVNMVDMTDATDPLNIYEGNNGLRNSRLHRVTLSAELMNPAKRLMQYITLKFSTMEDALAKGYIYESATGIRRFRTYNVNGNREGSASYGIGWQFGSGKAMTLQSLTTGSVVRSVDLVGEDDVTPAKSKVTSKGVNEILKWNWALGKNQIGLNADVTYRRFSGMTEMGTWQQKYGMTGLLNITKDLQVSTDFSVFVRSGFSDSSLNETDMVWNARVSYSMLKGCLVAMLDGFDMLHNLSNVTYSVNAQARTETFVNVLPRYFMFHLQWRFNRQPKKRR